VAVLKYHDGTGWEPVASALQGPTGPTGSEGNSYTAYRNLIINGAMQVAQRGTSTASITTSSYYTADRWFSTLSGLGTWTQSVEDDAPTGSGFSKSLKILCTTANAAPAASNLLLINQRIEGQNLQAICKGTSSAQQLTLSFWVKSNVTGTYIAELFDVDNTRQVSAAYSIASSGTWEKKTIVFPADTTGAFDNDNANSFTVNFFLGAGSDRTSGTLNTTWASSTNANRAVGQTNLAAATNNYWQITGVQLEVGAVDTPFEFKPFAQDLQECQRYYETGNFVYQEDRSGKRYITYEFVTNKRANPTITPKDGNGAVDRIRTKQSYLGANTDNVTGYFLGDIDTKKFSIGDNSNSANFGIVVDWIASIEL
jgi:hypothetical protein